jgi:hypothetical protein
MSDIWYYAVEDKEVGPLSLADLTAIFSHVSNARDVLVWRAGFEQWQRAATVPELAAFVIKPPPLRQPPPLLPTLPRDPLIVPARAVQSPNINRRNVIGRIATGVLIAVAIAGVRFLSHSGGVTSSPDPSSIISGKSRETFVAAGMGTCLKKQENDPDTKALSLPKGTLEKYCSCYMSALADTITNGDLRDLPKDGPIPTTMQKKISTADASCADTFRRSLLGGGR